MLIFRLCKLGFVIVSTLTKVFFGVLSCVLAEASSSSSGVSSNLEFRRTGSCAGVGDVLQERNRVEQRAVEETGGRCVKQQKGSSQYMYLNNACLIFQQKKMQKLQFPQIF